MNLERLREFQVLGDCEIENPRIRKLVEHVITRIPNECESEFPVFDLIESAETKRPLLGGVGGADELQIYVPAEKLDRECPDKDDPIIGIIAHEFAHAFLRHPVLTHDIMVKGGVQDVGREETETNKLAMKWGFGKEIEAAIQKFGDPVPHPNLKRVYSPRGRT